MANYLPIIKWAKQDNLTTAHSTCYKCKHQYAKRSITTITSISQWIKISNQNTCIHYSLPVLYSLLYFTFTSTVNQSESRVLPIFSWSEFSHFSPSVWHTSPFHSLSFLANDILFVTFLIYLSVDMND